MKKSVAFYLIVMASASLLSFWGCCPKDETEDNCDCPDPSYECNNMFCSCPEGTFDLGVRCTPTTPSIWICNPDCGNLSPMTLEFENFDTNAVNHITYNAGYNQGQFVLAHQALPYGDTLWSSVVSGPLGLPFNTMLVYPSVEGFMTPDKDSLTLYLTYKDQLNPNIIYQTCELFFHH